MKALIISVIITGILLTGLILYILFSTDQQEIENLEDERGNLLIQNEEPIPEIEKEVIPDQKPTYKEYSIEIKDFSFSHEELKIKQGDSVTWTNKDSVKHTVTSDSGLILSSPLLSKDQKYSKIFSQKGTFTYHCELHPYMKASIIVE